jgi:metallo-beta-lactamase family protein
MSRTGQADASLQFLGAAGTVTGAKFLLRYGDRQILIDCGLFQGLKELRLRNWDAPCFDPAAIDAVVLSHAHIDHSGYLPLLARRGFKGPIFCTPGTASLLQVLLPDAAHLQEEEAERANRYGYSKHKPALPLFATADAEAALRLTRTHAYGDSFAVIPGVKALFRRAGHILGSATVTLSVGERKPFRLVYSGDLGRWHRPILRDPELIEEADMLLIEATYGDRVHAADAADELARVVKEAAARGGALIVPAFAVGRTQELIWTLRQLEDAGRIPTLPVFVDSPMAINVTELYRKHTEDHDLDMKLLMDERRNPLSCRQFHLAHTAAESKALNAVRGPMIIISASGMATGGRVIHHLKLRLPDERTTVLLPGFQAAGTRGRSLQDGAPQIRMHGQFVPVRAKIETIDGFSAHADQADILRWLAGFHRPPARTFAVHGEPPQLASLAETIGRQPGWRASVARDMERVALAK